MSGMSLADYVWGDSKNDFTGFYGTAAGVNNPMVTDSATGKRKLPTQADVDAAEKPEDKIKLLTQMVDVVNIQADAAMTTGRADAIASMTKSAKDALASLNKVVDGLKTKDGSVADGKADPALKNYQTAISGALGSLRTAMDKIGALTPAAPTATPPARSPAIWESWTTRPGNWPPRPAAPGAAAAPASARTRPSWWISWFREAAKKLVVGRLYPMPSWPCLTHGCPV